MEWHRQLHGEAFDEDSLPPVGARVSPLLIPVAPWHLSPPTYHRYLDPQVSVIISDGEANEDVVIKVLEPGRSSLSASRFFAPQIRGVRFG